MIKHKDYFDNLFNKVDPNICLDSEQRRAILIDEDYEMVVAGAGSGKTTTMVGKINYLVDHLNVNPEDILVISYTNKAVSELKQQIYDGFQIPVKIGTFHHIALQMLKELTQEQYTIETNGVSIIYSFIREQVEKNERLRTIFNQAFSDYLYLPPNIIKELYGMKEFLFLGKENHSLLQDDLEIWYQLSLRYHCQMEFSVWDQHHQYSYFGKLSCDKTEIFIDYIDAPIKFPSKIKSYYHIFIKKFYHKQHHSHYIVIFKGDNIEKLLKEYCKQNHISLEKRNSLDYFHSLVNQRSAYQTFVTLIYEFILLWKRLGKRKLYTQIKKEDQVFLDVVIAAIDYYQKTLQTRNSLDFEDIIIQCHKKISRNYKHFPDYIIVDEYQDISRDRFFFLQKLCKLGHAKLIVVGDDWQSIYHFSGSDLDLFTSFKRYFLYCQVVSITNTYRNSQELIDISGKFIMKNKKQFKKQLLSKKHLSTPIYYTEYQSNKEKCQKLTLILNFIYQHTPERKILLVGRFSFDCTFLKSCNDFNCQGETVIWKKHPELSITYLTIHASKGLGFDEVIIVNNESGIYGFPCLKPSDHYINLLYPLSSDEQRMEERRLFYVALTRTKNHIYLLVPKTNPSEFIVELKKEGLIVLLQNL